MENSLTFMKQWLTVLSFQIITFALTTSTALAQEEEQVQWYEVEVILFEHLNPNALTAEQWPLKPGRPSLDNVITLLSPDQISETADETTPESEIVETMVLETTTGTPPKLDEDEPADSPEASPEQPYLILPAEQYQMQDQYVKLIESNEHQPLLHIAWRQVIPERNKPDAIHLHSDIEKVSSILIDNTPFSDALEENTLLLEFSDNHEAPPFSASNPLMLEPEEPTLNGILSLGLGRYIHVDADFMFKKPGLVDVAMPETTNFFGTDVTENFVLDNASDEIPEMFRIQGNLRLPSGEIHYLDHPMVGMLILFTRYTPPVIEMDGKSTLPPL